MDISELTKKNFETIGSSPKNIKIFENYISKDDCQNIIKLIKNNNRTNEHIIMSDSINNSSLSLIYYDSVGTPLEKIHSIHSLVEEEYETKIKFRHSRFTEWIHKNSQGVMIDDLGSKDSNHMSACIYINEDYEGGELEFIHQDVCFKPKSGDLLLFPGNIHYIYRILPAHGSSYFMQTWFDFV